METVIVIGALLLASLIPSSIKTEIIINKEPTKVMEVLRDTQKYKEWNPFIIQLNGSLEVGEHLDNVLQVDAKNTMKFAPVVLESNDNGLCWRGSVGVRYVFDGKHCFKVEAIGENQTKFTQSEEFQGVLVWPMFMMINSTQRNFEKMNIALKARVEQRD